MAKIVLNNISSRYASVAALNDNFTAIATAFENTLSRDGTTPNSWTANQDANSKRLLNLGTATEGTDAVSLTQVTNLINAAGTGLIASSVERHVATEGKTVFDLTSITYTPGVNNLYVYVNGVKHYNGLSYTETNSTRVTFLAGLNLGDVVEFITNASTTSSVSVASGVQYTPSVLTSGNVQDAIDEIVEDVLGTTVVGYNQGGTGAQTRTVASKLREFISVEDFGGSTTESGANNKTYFDAAWAASDPKAVYIPAGTYTVTGTVTGTFFSLGAVTINSGTVTSIINLTDADLLTWSGITPAANIGAFLATPSSANLAAAVTDETGTGALVFANTPTLVTPELGAATAASVLSTGQIGYKAGAGGTVTQTTNRSTAVTIDKLCGTITTDTTSLAAGDSAEFTVNNNTVAIGDVVIVSQQSGSSNVAGTKGTTHVHVVTVAAGSFIISVDNNSSTTAETGAIIINFAVIKAVTS